MRYIICGCNDCGHTWLATSEMPERCAKCKSSTWDGQERKPRGRPKKEALFSELPEQAQEEIIEQVTRDDVPQEALSDYLARGRIIKRLDQEERKALPKPTSGAKQARKK